jgi:predicted nucleic acid-binding protein
MTMITLEGAPVGSPTGASAMRSGVPDDWYVESSALAKLVVEEDRSDELRRWLLQLEERGGTVFVSDLGRTETYRAIVRTAPGLAGRTGPLFDDLARVRVSERDFVQARVLPPSNMRTLDALHLAVVLGLDGYCAGIVTYDRRIVEAAGIVGIRTVSP